MLFNSLNFTLFFLVTFLIYYIPRFSKFQVLILILASLFFYSFEQPALLFLLLFSAGINILCSYYLIYGSKSNKKFIAILGVTVNLFILGFFKYSGLIASSLNFDSSDTGKILLSLPLPIGISFFTFEGISLVVDSFKADYFRKPIAGKISIISHAKNTALFISFFPHLISGPILKAHEFFPQVKLKLFKGIEWESAFKSLVIGYFFKCVVADNLKDHTFWISYPHFQVRSTLSLISMLIGYSCQIFSDFAGYSLIAIGLAKLFGYNFIQNFNFPYIAKSFSEFWNRWHISLSSFLREYLYIPLGGNKKGRFRTYLNLLLTMILGGLWHGAAWSYAVWGTVHGLALVFERVVNDFFGNLLLKNRLFKIIKTAWIFVFVTFAWLLFKLPNFDEVIIYFECLIKNTNKTTDLMGLMFLFIYSLPVFLYHLYYVYCNHRYWQVVKRQKSLIYGLMLFMIIVNRGSSGSFIYFQF